MGLVVDANIVTGFFQESVLDKCHGLSASPAPIFDPATRVHQIFVDDQGIIEHEWRSGVQREWFDAWFTDLIRDGNVREIAAPSEALLRKELRTLGFPATGRDIWYVRVSSAVASDAGFCVLVSEDRDCSEPKEKQCSSGRRATILHHELGRVRKHLKNTRSILVKPVDRFVDEYPDLLK